MSLKHHENRFRPHGSEPQKSRPFQDIRPLRTNNFPDVGMTLSSYRSLPSPTIASVDKETMAGTPSLPRATARPRRRVLTKKRVALVITLLVLLVGGWVGVKFLSNALKVFHGNILSVLTVTKLKGEDVGRVNILVAGNSADDPGHGGADLTDSIMIISLDTKDHTAFLLSIPRDLWVNIPGHGYAKINEAYVDGEADHFQGGGTYPNGGMGLLQEIVQQDFGIPIDYYGLVNYSAFRDAVDAVGGIDVDIQSPDPRGLYDPDTDYVTHGIFVRLSNGVHHLNGEQALDLARARGDAYGSYGFPQSDFDRAQHQRQMLLALKTKALSAGVLANPVTLGNLFDSIGKNVQTGLSLSEAHRLYDVGKLIDNSSIKSESLNDANGTNLLANYFSPNGESALIPAAGLGNFSQIQLFVKRLTTNNPVLKENASVVVLNGTTTYGLASTTSKALAAHDVNVTAIGNAKTTATTTTIIDASGGTKPATVALLKQLYGGVVTTTNPYAGTFSADIILVVGNSQSSGGPSQ